MNDFSEELVGLTVIHNNICQSQEAFVEALRGFESICQIVDNATQSIDLLNKYGKDAIPQLNIDRGLEDLMGVTVDKITVEGAIKAIRDSVSLEGWQETLKGFFTKVYSAFNHLRNLKWTAEDVKELTSVLGEIESDSAKFTKFKDLETDILTEQEVRNFIATSHDLFKSDERLVANCKSVPEDISQSEFDSLKQQIAELGKKTRTPPKRERDSIENSGWNTNNIEREGTDLVRYCEMRDSDAAKLELVIQDLQKSIETNKASNGSGLGRRGMISLYLVSVYSKLIGCYFTWRNACIITMMNIRKAGKSLLTDDRDLRVSI